MFSKSTKVHTVVVDNGDFSNGMLSNNHFTIIGIDVKFDEERLIRFPHVIIDDLDFNMLTYFIGPEDDFPFLCNVIRTSFSGTVYGLEPVWIMLSQNVK